MALYRSPKQWFEKIVLSSLALKQYSTLVPPWCDKLWFQEHDQNSLHVHHYNNVHTLYGVLGKEVILLCKST